MISDQGLKLNEELFEKINIRRADISDKDILLEWRNNPKIREQSFNPKIISREEHEKWFNDLLKREDVILLIGILGNKKIGQVRFNLNNENAKISVNVAPEFIGKGLGPILIVKGCNFLFENTNCNEITAEIKPHNTASIKAFSRAGFKTVSSEKDKILMKYIKK